MAFTKKEWKDRVSQYPNRRTINDGFQTKLVTVGRSEGSVTEPGTSFNAANMNDLEERINEAFTNIIHTPRVNDKAPYQYRQTPVKANRSYEKLIGVSCAFNQLVQNGNFVDSSNWYCYDGTFSVSGNVASVDVNSANALFYQQNLGTVEGHKTYLSFDVKLSSPSTNLIVYGLGYYAETPIVRSASTTEWQSLRAIFVISDANPQTIYIKSDDGVNYDIRDVNIIDLTSCFGSEVADYLYTLEQNIAGSGIALFRQLFPEDYYAYQTATLISSKPTSKVVVGVNQFDKTNYVNDKAYGDGVEYNAIGFAHSDFIPCFPNISYYTSASAIGAFYTVDFFDKSKNYLSDNRSDIPGAGPGVFTTPENCYYMIVNTNKSQCSIDALCVNYPSTDHDYHAYEKHTYPLGGDELRGLLKVENGNIYADGDVYNADGNIERRYGTVDLSTLSWTYDGNGMWYTAKPTGSLSACDGVCDNFMFYINDGEVANALKQGITIYQNGICYCTSGDAVNPPTGNLVYELATPTTASGTPFSNPMLCGSTEEFTDSRSLKMFCGHDSYYEKDLIVPDTPTADGTYTLKCVVSHGEPTLNWQADS